jgi:hypothetical protein
MAKSEAIKFNNVYEYYVRRVYMGKMWGFLLTYLYWIGMICYMQKILEWLFIGYMLLSYTLCIGIIVIMSLPFIFIEVLSDFVKSKKVYRL